MLGRHWFRLTSVRTLTFDVNQMRVYRYEELYGRIANCPYGTCEIPGTSIRFFKWVGGCVHRPNRKVFEKSG